MEICPGSDQDLTSSQEFSKGKAFPILFLTTCHGGGISGIIANAKKPELLHCSGRVGAHPVQFVDEGEEGDVVTLHLPVDSDGLALDTSHSTENQDGSIQHPQRPLHFDGEVHMA